MPYARSIVVAVLVLAQPGIAQAQDRLEAPASDDPTARIGLSILGAVAGMAISVGIASAVFSSTPCGPESDLGCGYLDAAGAFLLSSIVLVPGGATLGGSLGGGSGSFWMSAAGHLASIWPGWLLAYAIGGEGDDLTLWLAVGLISQIVGAVLGYELSHDPAASTPPSSSPPRAAALEPARPAAW